MSGRGEPTQRARRLGLALLGILAGLPAATLGAEDITMMHSKTKVQQ